MSKAHIANLRDRLTNPKAYDVSAERAARREANRAKYPQVTACVDALRAAGITVTVEKIEVKK